MDHDLSHGWESIAHKFIGARSETGAEVVRRWARGLPPGAAVLDVGCGSGVPVSRTLVEQGFEVYAVDASSTLVAEFRRQFPHATVACEAAEKSALFGRTFAGAVAVGLLFLLPAADQREVVRRVAKALQPGGRFLFSAPREPCSWNDILTGRESLSLGEEEYRRILQEAGMEASGHFLDEGESYYIDAVRPTG